ncbi:UNVERIFIED_CONTAM: hypothetical protein GTU68_024319 [Idotea baltica]|nr:hypothetical protein [Idotea baltica]
MTSALFEPISIGPIDLPNRIVIAPMCQYSAQDGSATDWHMMHLGSLSLSGAGLLIIEATGVSPEARITYADLGLYSDENESALAQVLAGIRVHSDMPVAIQLAHAGRKASYGWQTVAPSAVGFNEADNAPSALDTAGMKKIIDDFVAAAKRTERLGIEGIEIHMAHGYLMHSFLSPLSNTRDDAYGGSTENRMRFPLEVFDAVKAAVSDKVAVFVRISASDWVEGGWDIDGSVALAKELDARGCAAIHVSSGGLSNKQQIDIGPGYQLHFAEPLKQAVSMPVIAVGLITEAQQAEDVITSGQADAVALARGILYDPRWPWHAAAELGASIAPAPQYLRCEPHGVKGLFKSA